VNDRQILRLVPKDQRTQTEAAMVRGWTVEHKRGGHFVWKWKGGGQQVATAATPSDYRGWRNHLALIRRIEKEYP